MSLKDNPLILRQIIMDHYDYPRNKELVEDEKYQYVHAASESCIDDIKVQALIEGNKVKDIRFDGIACTISTASTSIMSELLVDQTLEDAKVIIDNYLAMVDGQAYDEEMVGEAIAFHNVGKQANRIKCATIGWNAIKQIIDEGK